LYFLKSKITKNPLVATGLRAMLLGNQRDSFLALVHIKVFLPNTLRGAKKTLSILVSANPSLGRALDKRVPTRDL